MKYPLSELLDRVSICKLKAERLPSEETKNEYETLLSATQEYCFPDIDSYILKFFNVNSQIWDLESDLRNYKEKTLGYEEVGRRAITIRNLNDKRVAMKKEIEKTYMPIR